MRLILLGAPGSGKGTMAAELKTIYQIPHISTGDIFRANIKQKTSLGNEAEKYISEGELVPDGITTAMVADRLKQKDCDSGFLLDGFPRTIPQAEALEEILGELNAPLNAVINIVLSDQLVMKRLTSRRVCTGCGYSYNLISMPPKVDGVCDKCGSRLVLRDDDKEDTIRQRLATYHDQTSPLVEFYRSRGKLFDVSNEGAPEEALEKVTGYLSAE